jgi:DtxR family Mn-dependent transcriptional regulator
MPQLTESTEEYLEAVYKLSRESTATIGRLATALGVSAPSVSQMVGRLQQAGLVARDVSGGVVLTPEGLAAAARLVRRHRLSERFLSDYLDLPWDQVHDEACKFEHVLSDEVEERLAAQLGNPRTCPHGHVIPDEDGTVPETAVRSLT